MTIEVLDGSQLDAAEPLADSWGYTREEMDRLVRWCDGCARIAFEDGEAAGMAFGFPWGELGWIGSVLVLEAHRGEGLGQQIVEATLEALEQAGCTTVKLYATPKAISLYDRIGFEGETQYMVAQGTYKRGRDPDVVGLQDRVDDVLALDQELFPGDRSRMLEELIESFPATAIGTTDAEGELTGYALARPDPELTEVGPVVVRAGDANIAQQLVDGILVRVPEGASVELTYPDASWAARSSWECRGFVTIDTPLQMRKGPPVPEMRGCIVAAGGQDIG